MAIQANFIYFMRAFYLCYSFQVMFAISKVVAKIDRVAANGWVIDSSVNNAQIHRSKRGKSSFLKGNPLQRRLFRCFVILTFGNTQVGQSGT